MMRLTTFDDLLVLEMKDLYSAENQWLKVLPEMVEAAESTALKLDLAREIRGAERQMERIKNMMIHLDASPRGKSCLAMKGLVREAQAVAADDTDAPLKDARLIVCAQKVEHHFICGYGTARSLAHLLGFDKLAAGLREILDEKAAADREFTNLAVDIYTSSGPAEPLALVLDEPFRP